LELFSEVDSSCGRGLGSGYGKEGTIGEIL
jgi:hypothetical protein